MGEEKITAHGGSRSSICGELVAEGGTVEGGAGLRGAHSSRVGREEAGKKKRKWKKDERHRRLRNEEIQRTKKVWEHRLRRAGKLRQKAGEGGEKVHEDP